MYRKLLLFMTIAFALFMFSCKKDVNLDYEGECKNMRIAFLSGENGYASVNEIYDRGDDKSAEVYMLKNEKVYGVIYFDDDYTDSGMKTKVPAVTINFETGTTPELTEFTFNKRGTFKKYKAYKFLIPVEYNYIETHGYQELLFKIRAIYGYSNDDIKESNLKITCKAADPEDTYNIDENDSSFASITDKEEETKIIKKVRKCIIKKT